MTVRISEPLVVEVQDDDTMNELCDVLSSYGFLPRFGSGGLYPYEDFREEFYEESGTYPTHILLTDANVDGFADGPCATLCGEEELKFLDEQLIVYPRETTWDELEKIMRSW